MNGFQLPEFSVKDMVDKEFWELKAIYIAKAWKHCGVVGRLYGKKYGRCGKMQIVQLHLCFLFIICRLW